jgi:hypothetical protein
MGALGERWRLVGVAEPLGQKAGGGLKLVLLVGGLEAGALLLVQEAADHGGELKLVLVRRGGQRGGRGPGDGGLLPLPVTTLRLRLHVPKLILYSNLQK